MLVETSVIFIGSLLQLDESNTKCSLKTLVRQGGKSKKKNRVVIGLIEFATG
jgi:hypothetical protein